MSPPLLVVEDRHPEYGYHIVRLNGRVLGALATPIATKWDYLSSGPFDAPQYGVIELRFVEVDVLKDLDDTSRRKWSTAMGLRRPR
ncbi:hypothetical protein [Mycolicibacterium houstonense]|uniref:hypothetical protein n=1 Tax=Mycolicibacterium houstonense TaxID=146021 RepID=UPI000833BE36|nr:hypothetical protein [Mycolicibacterium houstonense]